MEPSWTTTAGVLILTSVGGVVCAALWATLNGVVLMPLAFLPASRGVYYASDASKQVAIWAGVVVELLSNTSFSLILCWACSRWIDARAVYMWCIWIAVWFIANAPLRWNLRDVTKAREAGNHHLLHKSVALAYLPVNVTTAAAIAWWAFR